MRSRFVVSSTSFCSFALLASINASKDATAQPVMVDVSNGVHVRAPFVSVDVYPRGGVSVRAPYTAVDVGPRPFLVGRPVYESALPSPQALAATDDNTLWQMLRATSLRLHERLGRFDTGSTWQRYFHLPDELALNSDADATQRRAALATLQQRFTDVAANPRYRKIADLPAFATMQALLSELAARQSNSAAPPANSIEDLPPPQQPPTAKDRSLLTDPAK